MTFTRITLLKIISFAVIVLVSGSSSELIPPESCKNSVPIYPFVFNDHAPRGNRSAGKYFEAQNCSNLTSCVGACCEKETCNVAMFYNQTCFLIECVTSAGCLPLSRGNNNNTSLQLEMVLVRTVAAEHQTWEEVLKQESEITETRPVVPAASKNLNFMNNFFNEKLYKALQELSSPEGSLQSNVYGRERFVNEDDTDLMAQEDSTNSYLNLQACVPGVHTCLEHEECQLISREGGLCKCRQGFYRYKHKCIARSVIVPIVPASFPESSVPQKFTDGEEDNQSEPEKTKLLVTVESKNIQLPENEASLTAIVDPDIEAYTYLWSLVDKPENDRNGTITDQTRKTVRVSKLSEGLYRFKLTVTGANSYGEAFANVTVSHAKRNNKPPTPIISPDYQVIKLPNQKAILDGSTSFDDDKIVQWKWELVQGPINYSPTLQQQATIELDDLKEPGNYTFKLTLTDSDKAENSTTAMIQVVEEIDYPPQSNAGADVILYLPHNNITLNGTLSTDDHQIVSWEWTKDASDESKAAADMQNTRTPFLELSHLEEGLYTFELKVTDAKGQNSSSKVHVFVKPPTNLPPVASAGKNVTISLPQTWTILNANLSTDDIKITQYYWKQISGPTTSIITSLDGSSANATMLTLGDYIFEVLVTDESNNNATDRVKITVIQEKNASPIARIIDGVRNVTLPLSVLVFNGSSSSDDLAIVNYSWTRESDSIAMGNVIGRSDHEPVLMLTEIVPGTYKYKLTVADEQGLVGSETATVYVHDDPMVLNLVEVVLTAQASSLTQLELDQLKQKLLLLLGDNVKLNVRNLLIEEKTNHVILVFYASIASKDGSAEIIMNGLDVQKILKEKFWKDYSILGSSISEIRTVICQNDCSGHGLCDTRTRACVCDTFWMPDIFFYWGVTEANCDWSILYVIVFIFLVFILIIGICWGLTHSCRNRKAKTTKTVKTRPTRPKRPQKYALLHTQEDELPSFNRNTLSDDSDTDSDVLFENSQQKSNGFRGNRTHKFTKLGRRIKT